MLSEIKKRAPVVKKPKVSKSQKEEEKSGEEKDFFGDFLRKKFSEKQFKGLEDIAKENKTSIYEITGLVLELRETDHSRSIDDILDELKKDAKGESLIFNNRLMRAEREKFIMEDKIAREKIVLQEGGLFKCTKCGSGSILVRQLQTRSADEPMTTFFSCTNCNNSWRG